VGLRRVYVVGGAVAILLFGLYLAAGFYLAPGLIRGEATDWVKTKLNKPIALGEIKVNPLSFTIDISDIAIPDASGPMMAVGHLRVGFSPLSVFADAWRLTELSIGRPYIGAVIRADGSLNLKELVPPPSPGEAPAFLIDTLEVDQGRIDFRDESRAEHPQETLSPISFTLKDFHTKKDEGGEFTLNAVSRRNEHFSWRGTLAMAPIASQGQFQISDLALDGIAPFVNDRLPVALTGGQLTLEGRYGFGFGADGLKLNMTLARLALAHLGFDGKDVMFHGAAVVDQVSASASFSLATTKDGVAPGTASLPHLALQGVTLTGTGPAKDQTIKLTGLTLDNAKLDYAGHDVELGTLALNGLALDVRREKNGAISLSQWLPAPASTAPASAAAPAPWVMRLANFTLSEGAVAVEDQSVTPAAHLDVKAISVTASGIGSDTSKPVALQASAEIDEKGRARADVSVTPGTGAAELKLALAGVPLKPAAGYLGRPGLDLKSGALGLSGALSLSGGAHSAMRFKGAASIDDLGVYVQQDNSPLLAWKSLQLSGIDYGPGKVAIQQARLSKPLAGVSVLADRSFNFTSLMTPQVAVATPSQSAPPMNFVVKTLAIDGGTLGFADYSIDPNFAARIEALSGSIENIASAPDAIAKIDLQGQVIDRFSPVSISGTANLLGYDKNTDISLAFRNIELPIFNPYSGRYAGYAIGKGKLTTELHYRIVNRALQADHHVVIDQLEWGAATATKPSVPWPVELVTSLLKDRNGVIDLSLPVKGSLDDPSFRIWPVIWQIVGNLIDKIVTAPFSLIGSLFAGAEKAQYIDFAPGSAAWPAGSADGLAALAKGLSDRPALKLDIPAAPALKEDAVAMADAHVDAGLMADEIKKGRPADPAQLKPDDLHDRLESLYRTKLGKRPAYPETLPPAAGEPAQDVKLAREMEETAWLRGELRNAFLPSNTELAGLGSTRATAVRDALLAKGDIDAARVFLVTDATGIANEGHVRLELKLR
jgi:hypothetical protein